MELGLTAYRLFIIAILIGYVATTAIILYYEAYPPKAQPSIQDEEATPTGWHPAAYTCEINRSSDCQPLVVLTEEGWRACNPEGNYIMKNILGDDYALPCPDPAL